MPKTVQFQLGGTLKILSEDLGGCLVTLQYRDFTITAWGDDMAYTLASGMQVAVQVSYVDAAGNPAAIDGEVHWSSSDEARVSLFVDPDDSSKATVRAVGTVGQVQVTATADADLGEGTRQIITPMDVEVVAGEAMAGTIAPIGSAEPIPQVEHH